MTNPQTIALSGAGTRELTYEQFLEIVQESHAEADEFRRRYPLPPAPGFAWGFVNGRVGLIVPRNFSLAGLAILAATWKQNDASA